MPSFLIDANLPAKLAIWNTTDYEHVLNINPSWDDETIWQYAKEKELTIVSKDKDFYLKQLLFGSPPKLVQVKFGNLKLSLMIQRLNDVWPFVVKEIEHHSLVIIYQNKIETVK